MSLHADGYIPEPRMCDTRWRTRILPLWAGKFTAGKPPPPSQISKVKPINGFRALIPALEELLIYELFRTHSSRLSLKSSFLLM